MLKTLRKLDSSGDTVVQFETETTDEASLKAFAEARALFENLTGKGGFTALDRSGGPDAPSRRIDQFDQLGTETILIPRIVGG